MKQLHPNQYKIIRGLFHANYPNLPLVYGVIEQYIPGQIWVDKENEPTVCLIMTGAGYCFIAGDLDEEKFKEFFKLLEKQKRPTKVAIEKALSFDISTFGFIPVPRRHYRYKNIHGNIPVYENNSGYLLKKIEDEATFDLCMWKPLMLGMFGDAETYLKNGLGFILWDTQNNIIASESHGMVSNEYVEIGTVTNENYRGRNLSTILCNHLIRYAINEGLQPVWSCDDSNVISWRVAEKQGMDELMRYTFYTLSQ